jgi:hypothetical protein
MAIITEERFFSTTGQLMKWTKTPLVTDIRQYPRTLRSPIIGRSFHRYEGKRGICFLLQDGTIRIIILGQPAEAMAATMTPAMSTAAIAAD